MEKVIWSPWQLLFFVYLAVRRNIGRVLCSHCAQVQRFLQTESSRASHRLTGINGKLSKFGHAVIDCDVMNYDVMDCDVIGYDFMDFDVMDYDVMDCDVMDRNVIFLSVDLWLRWQRRDYLEQK